MDIRPQDLPELRAEAVAFMLGNQVRNESAVRREMVINGVPEDRARSLAAAQHRIVPQKAKDADLFWVSSDMAAVAQAASATLPSFIIEMEDLPTPVGFMVFQRPVCAGLSPDGEEMFLGGALWAALAGSGVSITPLWERETLMGERMHRGMPPLVVGIEATITTPFGNAGWMEFDSTSIHRVMNPLLIAAWLLMQQPLAAVGEAAADRAAQKRIRRAGHEPAKVRVIGLRRAKSSAEHGDGESSYQHQWIVRGHWRNHWHPKREVHRPVWIAPHVKGPEGAPMIGGEKVYAWKR